MSGALARKRVLKTTVAAAAAGAVVFTPLAPLAQAVRGPESGAASLDPVAIRIGANAQFTRVEFAGVVGSRARVRQDGDKVIVRIGTTAAPDVSRLRVDPPAGVASVQTRPTAGGVELVISLAEGAGARWGSADGAVWLNLYESAVAAPARAAVQSAVVPVRAEVSDDKAVLNFQWAAPVGAAVFRRGEAVWIVFDAAARLDMAGARALGPDSDARWAAGPDYTVLRIAAPEDVAVEASGEGGRWTVTLGGPRSGVGGAASTGVDVGRDDGARVALVARMAGATKTIWLTDPLAGDRFAAVTALAPGKGFAARRQLVDLTLLPTAQGLAVETSTDDLTIQPDGDLVTIGRPRGLNLSAPSAALERAIEVGAPRRAPRPALILSEWSDFGDEGFMSRHARLQQAAMQESERAGDDVRAPAEARLAFARFLVGSGLGFEAVGVLNALAKQNPAMQGEPELRGLRGAARVAIGRLDEAQADFAVGALAGDAATQVWRGYIAAEQGRFAEARQAFAAGVPAIDAFPAVWKARFGAAHALAALETGDLPAARALLAFSFSQPAPAADQLTARLVQARLFELEGQGDRALAVYKAVARAPLDGVATPARLGVIKLEMARGEMKPDAAAGELEQLKWRWRGDATELAVIRSLGDIYLSQGRYREALDALRGAGKRMAQLPGAVEIQTDLSNAFRALFLDGGADGLQPIQALGLFYDFRELTPVGADGDDMVRRLARRLVDVDLLGQAAELLKYQVDNRLEGVAKAQVATDLATVYLMNRQPEQALQAIWSSRTTLLPTAINLQRRSLEARALSDLGRYEHALEVLDRDQSPAARAVRADIAWKQQQWPSAAGLYDGLLADRWRDAATPLTPEEESRLIRAGVAYSLAGDSAGLSRLSRNYQGLVGGARQATALRIALDGGELAQAQDYAALASSADTFSGWVTAMKADLRQKTGGDRPAAPARQQADQATPAAGPAAA
jgi:tetratricopeptide (TPR) repeat protein